ncbi:hypothetical protein BU202_01995 [Streptococcus cuniculi]|uniref:Uncharacterized protein n=1 Tax=Streptococcus cuniculi TaxID=1432788 RepID=A0A1Q8E9E3_9STRE|nr:hypothetical protein [Streptococcus cuniculi]OLF48413.1 hypothetical protein BU202_01995 [Streptococcus cuniculi]
MEKIETRKSDALEIYKTGGKYILRYPTFNSTMPEVEAEIPEEAVNSYLAGEHTGEELIFFSNTGNWRPKITQEEANRIFLRENPEFLLIDTARKRQYFSEEEFQELLKKAYEVSEEQK